MAFRLILCTKLPGKKVLTAETTMSGVDFYVTATECLRKTIPDNVTMTHQSYGALDKYIIILPTQLAFDSGKFESSNDAYLIVPEGYLNQYIFYVACENSSSKRCYPFTSQNSVTITSRIDELACLQAWKDAGYPDEIRDSASDSSDISNIPIVDDVTDIGQCQLYPNCTVLDRIEDVNTSTIDGTQYTENSGTTDTSSSTSNPTKLKNPTVLEMAKRQYGG